MPLPSCNPGISAVPVGPSVRIWLPTLVLVGVLVWLVSGRQTNEVPATVAVKPSVPMTAVNPEIALEAPKPEGAGAESEAPQPTSMVDITRIVARRASDTQREDYRRRLDNDPDLLLLAAQLKRSAETGDSDAAAALANLHAFCAEVLRIPVPPRTSAPKATNPRAQPAPLPAQRCAGLGAAGELTALNLRSTARAWRHTAALLGDLPSRLIGDGSHPRPGSQQALARQDAAEEMLRRGDYAALRDHANQLNAIADAELFVAIRSSLCLLAGACTTADCRFLCETRMDEEWNRLAPREQRVRLGQQAVVLSAIRSGQYGTLWAQPPDGAPP